MQINVENNEIVIRFPIEHIDSAFMLSPYVQNLGDSVDIHITDDLANSLVETLRMEREDGSTFIHDAIDSAFEYIVEYGLDGVEIFEKDEE